MATGGTSAAGTQQMMTGVPRPASAKTDATVGPSIRQGVLMAGNSRPSVGVERAGDREKSLEAALSQIERQFGKGSVMRLGDEVRVPVEIIPTGSIALDVALGLGGLPRGRVVEIYGPESSGKTTVALHALANAQKLGGIAAFIDAEHALDPDYAKKLGVDTDALLVSQPDTGEQALEIMDMLIRSGAIDIVVIDSVAALVPRAEIEGEMGDSHVGLQARLMSQALRKITGALSQTKTTAIFINQLREKVGVMFGSPETTTGGKALKFYASIRLDIRRIETLKDGTEAVGNRTRIKVVKNKMSPPFKIAEFDILYGIGISREGGLIDLGVEQGIVRKAGAWYTYEGDQLGQGKENARNFLQDNPDLANEIEKRIKEKLGVGPKLDADPLAGAAAAGAPAPSTGAAPGTKGTTTGPGKAGLKAVPGLASGATEGPGGAS
jgi:recombination protein RecA